MINAKELLPSFHQENWFISTSRRSPPHQQEMLIEWPQQSTPKLWKRQQDQSPSIRLMTILWSITLMTRIEYYNTYAFLINCKCSTLKITENGTHNTVFIQWALLAPEPKDTVSTSNSLLLVHQKAKKPVSKEIPTKNAVDGRARNECKGNFFRSKNWTACKFSRAQNVQTKRKCTAKFYLPLWEGKRMTR